MTPLILALAGLAGYALGFGTHRLIVGNVRRDFLELLEDARDAHAKIERAHKAATLRIEQLLPDAVVGRKRLQALARANAKKRAARAAAKVAQIKSAA